MVKNSNIRLGTDNASENIHKYQNDTTLTVSGDDILYDAYHNSQHAAYSIRDHQMNDSDENLILLGNGATARISAPSKQDLIILKNLMAL